MARMFLEYDDGLSSWSYYNTMIRRLITIATPHEGSTMTMYLHGDVEKIPYLQDPRTNRSEKHIARAIEILRDERLLRVLQDSMGKTDSYTPGAWIDLEIGSELVRHLHNDVGKPSSPIHVIYGTIDNGNLHSGLFTVWSGLRTGLVPIPKEYRDLIAMAPDLLNYYGTFKAFFTVMFNNEHYDIAVGESSTVSIFDRRYMTSENEPYKSHVTICFENSIGDRVLDLLKGDLSKFDTSGVGRKSAQSINSYSTNSFTANSYSVKKRASLAQSYIPSETQAVNDYFLTKYTLTATLHDGSSYNAPATFIADGSTDITFP